MWFSFSSRVSDHPIGDDYPSVCPCILVPANYGLVAVEPVEQPGGEATKNAPAAVAELASVTGDEALPEGATGLVTERGADSEMDIPVCMEAATPELDESEVDGAVSVSVDDGSVDVATEASVQGAVSADEEPPPSCLGVLDEAEEGAPDTNVVDGASVDGVPPVETGEDSSTLDVATEVVADSVVAQAEDGAIEQISEPAVHMTIEPEVKTEPEPEPDAKTEPEPESEPAAGQAVEEVVEVGMDSLPDICENVAIGKGPDTEGVLTVNIVTFACYCRISHVLLRVFLK